ncbi:MAG: hypothetical protein ACYCS4_07225 [Acidimicrobiales bacterium]
MRIGARARRSVGGAEATIAFHQVTGQDAAGLGLDEVTREW